LVCCLQLASFSAGAEDVFWQSFDNLGAGDRSLAEAALANMFGEDPELWPDWLNPRALLLPLGRNGTMLVVREPYRAPCGQFLFKIFGPTAADGVRQRLGADFCAGDLAVTPIRGRPFPDLIFAEGYQRDPAEEVWRRVDQHVRWTGTEWVRLLPK
jgi:hypothetical protein